MTMSHSHVDLPAGYGSSSHLTAWYKHEPRADCKTVCVLCKKRGATCAPVRIRMPLLWRSSILLLLGVTNLTVVALRGKYTRPGLLEPQEAQEDKQGDLFQLIIYDHTICVALHHLCTEVSTKKKVKKSARSVANTKDIPAHPPFHDHIRKNAIPMILQ